VKWDAELGHISAFGWAILFLCPVLLSLFGTCFRMLLVILVSYLFRLYYECVVAETIRVCIIRYRIVPCLGEGSMQKKHTWLFNTLVNKEFYLLSLGHVGRCSCLTLKYRVSLMEHENVKVMWINATLEVLFQYPQKRKERRRKRKGERGRERERF